MISEVIEIEWKNAKFLESIIGWIIDGWMDPSIIDECQAGSSLTEWPPQAP